jgi:hypothetical protein
MREATDWVKAQRAGLSARDLRGAQAPCLIWVTNTTGADLPRFAVVRTGDGRFDPETNPDDFAARVLVNAAKPKTTSTDRVAITIAPIPDGKAGQAVISGAVPVKLRLPDDYEEEDGTLTTAGPATDDTDRLHAGQGTIPVLWHAPGEAGADVWAYVRLPAGSGPWIEFSYGGMLKATDWDQHHHGRVIWTPGPSSMTAAQIERSVTIPDSGTWDECGLKIMRPGLVHVEMELAVDFGDPIGNLLEKSIDQNVTADGRAVYGPVTMAAASQTVVTSVSVDAGGHVIGLGSTTLLYVTATGNSYDYMARFYDPDKDWQWAHFQGSTTAAIPDWISTYYYYVGDQVKYGGKYYECIEENMDEVFDPNKWTEIPEPVGPLSGADDLACLVVGRLFPDHSGSDHFCEFPNGFHNSCFRTLDAVRGQMLFTDFTESLLKYRGNPTPDHVWSNLHLTIRESRTRLRLEWLNAEL